MEGGSTLRRHGSNKTTTRWAGLTGPEQSYRCLWNPFQGNHRAAYEMKVNIFKATNTEENKKWMQLIKKTSWLRKLHITSQWLINAENEAWRRGVGAAFGLMKLP